MKKPTDPCAASNKVTCGNSSLCCEKCNAPSVTYTPCGECGTRTETCSATKNSYGFYYLTTTACVDL
ncbi:MAG: hypothetical protein LBR90_04285 [Elusimicrobiota bacterium]|nr:hypothetical protein [Elusimicrobiota bacterium]